DPEGNATEPKITIWSIATEGSQSAPVQIAEGDSPAVSSTGLVAYVKDGQIWSVPLAREKGKAREGKRLFFDRGKDDGPVWSKDGTRLAFVSGRSDHSFIGVFTSTAQALVYLVSSTNFDKQPVWSP